VCSFFEPRLSVDCEYNRDGQCKKRLPRDEQEGLARPDIIVHRRGTETENLIVIEAKKSNGQAKETKFQVEKWVKAYSYKIGVYLELAVPKQSAKVDFIEIQDGVWGWQGEREIHAMPRE
jgi:hypothetical protein